MAKKRLSEQLRRTLRDAGETRYSISNVTGITEGQLRWFRNGAHRPMKWLSRPMEFDVLAVDDDDAAKGRSMTTEETEKYYLKSRVKEQADRLAMYL